MLAELRAQRDWNRVGARLDEVTTFATRDDGLAVARLPAEMRRRGFRVGVLTLSPEWYAKSLLDTHSIRLDALITGSAGFTAKPDPTGLLALARELGVAPGDCVYVGDSVGDFGAAAAAGMRSVGVTWGASNVVDWRRSWPDVTIGRPSRLVELVEGATGLGLLGELCADGEAVTQHAGSVITPAAMRELHERLNAARADGTYDELRLSSAYVFDFLVIHPFRDGNGRMSRLATLWLLYLGGHEVGRYVSLEKIIEDSKDTYYQALAKSTVGWHEGEHDLSPWLSYFLGIVVAAYKEFEDRTGLVGGRGSKRARIERFIETNLSDEFTIAEVRQASPQASDSYIRVVLGDLKASRAIEPVGRGRGPAGGASTRPKELQIG